ncbi:MAG: ribonuclease HI [Candidatus Nomurabacteria bacterium]|jgi:ribonuclease HI|nr:ribonuclease HI [Candidatus Nomurabacteria bacterium]
MNLYFTDGSAMPNPGDGGWAVVRFIDEPRTGEGVVVASGAAENTTNIRMEGYALEAAIKVGMESGEPYKIITDSMFWCNVLMEWAPEWAANDWKKKTKGKIQNLDLVQKLYALYQEAKPTIEWTRGHVGTLGNEAVDEAANIARAEGVKNGAQDDRQDGLSDSQKRLFG